jgi:osmotically-inducible protein OsmY
MGPARFAGPRNNAGGRFRLGPGIAAEIRTGGKYKMPRRHDYDREHGYGGNWDEQRRRSGPDREHRDEPRYSGYCPKDQSDESYFGGSRRYGEGNRESDSRGDRGSFGRSLTSYRSDSDDDRFFGENYPDRGRYDSYYEDSPHRGYGRAGYQGTSGGGMYGGGIGGYSGGGSQGWDREGYQTRNYPSSRGSYGSRSPESESGYASEGRDRGWWDRTSDEVASWFGDEEAERRRRMDHREDQGHRGKGPKNYTRSDDRIKENVSERLEDNSYLDASDIDIEVNGGQVVLSGTVDSRYAKRLAEDLAERCSGVRNVENRIRVNSEWFNNRSSSSVSNAGSLGATPDSSASGTQSRTATGRQS